MNKLPIYIFILIFALGCKEINTNDTPGNKPCDALVNGVYQYPEIPEGHDWTTEQVKEYINLPDSICECISTDGLIQSCLDYPFLSLINAVSSTTQNGYYFVESQFRGLTELEDRDDAATCLLNYYLSIDPSAYDQGLEISEIAGFAMDVLFFEVIFSQQCFLSKLKGNELINLIKSAIEKYDKRINDEVLFGERGSLFILARLMFMNNYSPFIEIYESDQSYQYLVNELELTNSSHSADEVISLSRNYLETLINNEK
jgi:hypothetical protein